MLKRLTKILIASLSLCFLAQAFACNAPDVEAKRQNERMDAKSKTVDAKKNYEAAIAKAAKLRDEAAKLQVSNDPQDMAKGAQLMQEAAKIEADAMQNLPNDMR